MADALRDDALRKVVPAGEVSDGWRIVDVGPETLDRFSEAIRAARTVLWNGPLGASEIAPFAHGTSAVARILAESDAISIVCGGDTVAAVRDSGHASGMAYLSTGGGASLALLRGEKLPAVEALASREPELAHHR